MEKCTPIGFDCEPVSYHDVEYHMAFVDNFDYGAIKFSIIFEGKQDDLFYFYEIKNDLLTGDINVDTETIKKLINDGEGVIRLKWWEYNDAECTDNPGINIVNGKLVYYLKLTNKITLQIITEHNENTYYYMDYMNEMLELCRNVKEGKYELRAF